MWPERSLRAIINSDSDRLPCSNQGVSFPRFVNPPTFRFNHNILLHMPPQEFEARKNNCSPPGYHRIAREKHLLFIYFNNIITERSPILPYQRAVNKTRLDQFGDLIMTTALLRLFLSMFSQHIKNRLSFLFNVIYVQIFLSFKAKITNKNKTFDIYIIPKLITIFIMISTVFFFIKVYTRIDNILKLLKYHSL